MKYFSDLERICALFTELFTQAHETGTSGNMSVRISEEAFAIKPTGCTYRDITTDSISQVSLKNGLLLKGLRPSSDVMAHLSIYRARPDIQAVLHTHSHFATVMALCNEPLNTFSTMHVDYFGQKIPCLPFINHRDSDFGLQIIQAGVDIALLEKHGAVILLKDPLKAPTLLCALEESAKLNYHTLTLSRVLQKKIEPITSKDAEKMHRYYKKDYGQK
jgi:L-ribulose-5-phosphate 4-epimerase